MKKKIILKIKNIKKKFKKIENLLQNNNLNINKYKKINKKYNKIKKIINIYEELKKYKLLKIKSKKLINIKEIKDLALEDIKYSNKKIKELKNNINIFFKKKKKKEKIFLEIKNGTGGDESSIFASDLFKMYSKYIEKKKWKYKIISLNITDLGGYKNIILLIKGKSVYNNLKFESGVHRVQRSPKTETQGRIHTSTCKVAVLPKIKKLKFKINNKDLKIETFKSSGAGGQHVNKTDSAVRIKHIPTKISVECQNSRSQHKNKKDALKLLKFKIFNLKINEEKNKKDKIRKNLFGVGIRSEKIRTYNYTKNRFTDHRIKFTKYNLNSIMNGDLEEIIKKLKKKNK
ncbi:Peptide chain release factor 1 [Candidatus Nasuia deltocephalinicola]|nr:Peptide chain release factor 1 [Candidatus Nasuia deltocephalinicola]